jgi:nucleoside-diphosphate-sugar epimerase
MMGKEINMPTQNDELQVVFGTGPAGAAAVRTLFEAGKQVRAINRSGRRNALLPEGVDVAAADVTDPASARRAVEEAAVIYNCLNAPYHRWEEMFPPLQNGILQAARDAEAKLVVLENLYMYGLVDGPMTEDLPYKAHTRKGKLRARLSRELSEGHERGDIQVAIGRASDFYGPGVVESALGERTFAPLVSGKPAEALGNPDHPHSYAYIDDVGRGLAALGQRSEAFGEIWHLPHAPAISTREMLKIAFEHLNSTLYIQAA